MASSNLASSSKKSVIPSGMADFLFAATDLNGEASENLARWLCAAGGRSSRASGCAAVCVQRRRSGAKAHTGHRKPGSDGSAASGGRSDLSEWQRSADEEAYWRRRRCRVPQQDSSIRRHRRPPCAAADLKTIHASVRWTLAATSANTGGYIYFCPKWAKMQTHLASSSIKKPETPRVFAQRDKN